jgi:hypothetical protein
MMHTTHDNYPSRRTRKLVWFALGIASLFYWDVGSEQVSVYASWHPQVSHSPLCVFEPSPTLSGERTSVCVFPGTHAEIYRCACLYLHPHSLMYTYRRLNLCPHRHTHTHQPAYPPPTQDPYPTPTPHSHTQTPQPHPHPQSHPERCAPAHVSA